MTQRINQARVERLRQGDWSWGCNGRHRGVGTVECPWNPHHHHDDFCIRPTILELRAAGIDPDEFHTKSRRRGTDG